MFFVRLWQLPGNLAGDNLNHLTTRSDRLSPRGGLHLRASAEVKPLEASTEGPPVEHKLVAFVPDRDVAAVVAAMHGAGAGVIGDYDCCAFQQRGMGSFRCGAATTPAIGTPGAPALSTLPDATQLRARTHAQPTPTSRMHVMQHCWCPGSCCFPTAALSPPRAGQNIRIVVSLCYTTTVMGR